MMGIYANRLLKSMSRAEVGLLVLRQCCSGVTVTEGSFFALQARKLDKTGPDMLE